MSSRRPATMHRTEKSRHSSSTKAVSTLAGGYVARTGLVPLSFAAVAILLASPAAAQQVDCGLEGSLKAVSGHAHVDLTFQNPLAQSLRLYWIDFQGHRKAYGVIAAGADHKQPTSEGNHWLVVDDADKCVALFAVPPVATTFVIALPAPSMAAPTTTPPAIATTPSAPAVGTVIPGTYAPAQPGGVVSVPAQTIVVAPVVSPANGVVTPPPIMPLAGPVPVFGQPVSAPPVNTPPVGGLPKTTPITTPPTSLPPVTPIVTPPTTGGPVTTPIGGTPVTPIKTPVTTPPTTLPVKQPTTPPNQAIIKRDKSVERSLTGKEKRLKLDEAKAEADAKASAAKATSEEAKAVKNTFTTSKSKSEKTLKQAQHDLNAEAQANARAKADAQKIQADQRKQALIQRQLNAAKKGKPLLKAVSLPKKCGKPKCT